MKRVVASAMLFALTAAVLFALTGCDDLRARRARSRAPHVVLVSIDTLNVNHVSPYNPSVTTTPFLKRFADHGVRFEHAYTHTPITLPSHASLMTGVSPPSLGVMANGDRVPDAALTLAEIFRAAGYRTSAFISLGVLQEPYGLHQGFEIYNDPFATGPVRWYRRAHEIIEPIESWIGDHRDEPFFMWAHFSDPHEPYIVPDAADDVELTLDGERVGAYVVAGAEHRQVSVELSPGTHELRWTSLWASRDDDRPETGVDLTLLTVDGLEDEDGAPLPPVVALPVELRPDLRVALTNPTDETVRVSLVFAGRLQRPPPSFVLPNYDENIGHVDRHLQKLDDALEAAGIRDDTLVVIVSDHGEGLFAHDILGHASHVYEDQLRIVWMMRGAGLPEGMVIRDRPGLMTDVAPTMLDILGLHEGDMEGRSWSTCLTGGSCPEDRTWWSYGLNHSSRGLTGMAGYRWPYKWIWRRSFKRIAFDASKDPHEENDLLENAGPDNPLPLKKAAESFRAERRRLSKVLASSSAEAPSDERQRLLESLGYLGGGASSPEAPDYEDDLEEEESPPEKPKNKEG